MNPNLMSNLLLTGTTLQTIEQELVAQFSFLAFWIISMFFGPGMAMAYGIEHNFRPLTSIAILFVLELIAIVIVYKILERLPLEKRYTNKYVNKILDEVDPHGKGTIAKMGDFSTKLKIRWGEVGFMAALVLLTIAYGVYVGAVFAYFIRLTLRDSIFALTVGAFAGLTIWYGIEFFVPAFAPVLFVIMTGGAICMLLYGYVQRNERIKKMVIKIVENEKKNTVAAKRKLGEAKTKSKRVGENAKADAKNLGSKVKEDLGKVKSKVEKDL